MNSDIETRHLYTFFKLNRQLKSVKIVHCGGCIFDEIFPRIATNLPELESLIIEIDYFQNFNENILSLLRLENLRELQLNCSMYSIASFVESLAAKGKIELLHLSDGLLNDSLIDAIAKCKKLTSLKLCSMPSVHNRFLAELAENLPELHDFHISKCQTLNATGVVQFANLAAKLKTLHISNSSVDIDNTFFQSLVTVYQERGTRLTISLNKMSVKVSPEMQNENKQFVEIVRSNEYFLYDVFGDELSEIDDSDDDDDDDGSYTSSSFNSLPFLSWNQCLFLLRTWFWYFLIHWFSLFNRNLKKTIFSKELIEIYVFSTDSDDDSWNDYGSLDSDLFEDDQFPDVFDFNPNMWNIIIYWIWSEIMHLFHSKIVDNFFFNWKRKHLINIVIQFI